MRVVPQLVQSSASRNPQTMCFRNRLARGPHPRQASPDRALLANLVRLEFIKVAEAHLPRFDDDGAGRERRPVELEAPLRAHDDAAETRVFTAAAAARP